MCYANLPLKIKQTKQSIYRLNSLDLNVEFSKWYRSIHKLKYTLGVFYTLLMYYLMNVASLYEALCNLNKFTNSDGSNG